MTIQPYIPGEEKAIHTLIKEVYDEFVAPEYNEKGNRHFYEFIEEKALAKRFRKKGHYMWTAKDKEKITGVIAIRDRNHLALLFVEKNQQGKGLGRKLLNHAIRQIQAQEGRRVFTVNSSLFAAPIYRKWGFKSTSGITEVEGIKFIPMRWESPVNNG